MSDYPWRTCTCGETRDNTNLRAALVFGRTHHFDTLPCHDKDCSEVSCPSDGVLPDPDMP